MRAADPEQVEEWKTQVLTAYEATGNITASCQRVGISTARHKKWLKADPDYRSAVIAITDRRRAAGLSTGRGSGRGRPVARTTYEQRVRFLEAFRATGNIRQSEEMAGVPHTAFYRWSADPEFVGLFDAAVAKRRAQGLSIGRVYRPHTPESRAKMSEGQRAAWARKSPEEQARHRELLRHINRRIKGGGAITSLEAAVIEHMTTMDVPYLLHKPLGEYVLDIFVPSLRLDVEADGEYWHGPGAEERQTERDAFLEAEGIVVLRLTETEIKTRDFARLDVALRGPRRFQYPVTMNLEAQ